jgi:Rnl2 family RNA ligase
MKFAKYNSIDNTNRKATIDYIVANGFSEGEWVAENKIHGANFSIWFDGNTARFAKRSGFIGEGENFYNFRELEEDLTEKVKHLFNLISRTPSEIVVYGELFGGSYPDHKSNTKAVQKGVYYTPDIAFHAFDLMIDGKYCTVDVKNRYFEQAGITFCEPLFRGSFRDALEFNPVFEDPTHKKFGLPSIEGNMSEGVVLKPVSPAFFATGSRVILKNKNPDFSEKKNTKKNGNKETVVIDVSDQAKEELQNILLFVTENRLRNVLSKIGEVTNKDFGRVIKDFNEDILEDYLKEYAQSYQELEHSEQKIITKTMNKSASKLLRDNFLNIIDGVF